jgi:hypothetical protein
MINPLTEIKKGFKNLFSGAITHDAATVPYYENEGALVDYQILLTDASYQSESTKHDFYGSARVRFEVVTEKNKSNTQDADTILNSMLMLLFPTPRTSGLSVTGFKVIGIKKNIGEALKEESGNGSKIVRRPLELNFFINQINL